MNRIYQRIIDKGHGDCMQATVASLLDLEYEDTPAFIELGQDWFKSMCDVFKAKGYAYDGVFYNKKWNSIIRPTAHCFDVTKFHRPSMLTKANLIKSGGIDGLFFARVLSPKLFNWADEQQITHAVICDYNMNIIHDPNREYSRIVQYPLADVIGCNGIISVYDFKKID